VSLLWHLLKTDLRHTRWSLLAWTLTQLLFAAASLAYWYTPDWFTPESASYRPTLVNSIPAFAMILVAFDFGVRLIQSDNPALSNAFWRTRPIHPLRLLAAKLCAALVALTLTTLPSLALIACAFRDLPLNLLGTQYQFHLWIQVFPILVAIPFGSLTTSSRQCLLATILTITAAGIFAAMQSVRFTDDGSALEVARMRVIATILGLTALAAVLRQFLSGDRPRSLLIASLGVAAALSTPWWWSGSLRPEFLSVTPEKESPLTHAVTLKTIRQIDNAYTSSRSGTAAYHYDAVLENLPASHAFSVTSGFHRWPMSGAITPISASYVVRTIDSKNLAAFLSGSSFPTNSTSSYRVSQNEERWRDLLRTDSPKKFSAGLTFTLATPEIVYALPLRSREAIHNGAGRARIADVNPAKGTIWVSAVAFTQLPPKSEATPLPFPDAVGYIETSYALRNTTTGEQFPVSREHSTSAGLFSIWKFRISSPDKVLPPTPDWLEHAELLVIATRPVAQFTRTFTSTP
jgi:hypothetical protein